MKCVLMNKNTPVIEVFVDDGIIYKISNAYDVRYLPPCVTVNNDIVNKDALKDWWKNRSVPASRDNLRNGLINLGYEEYGSLSSPLFLLEKSFGLSLSDQYWLKPEGSNIEWKDVSYFTNNFSDDVGKALFDNIKTENPDLNSPCNTLEGNLIKKWTVIDGKRCIVKGGSFYYQEPFNEVVASEICNSLNIPHIPYTLKIIHNKPFCVCENFITPETELVTAYSLLKSYGKYDSHNKYESFIKACEENKIPAVENFCDEMIVLDYIIGNHDRHFRNFGVIRNVETLEYVGFAPIFDTGASLRYYTPHCEIDLYEDLKSVPFKAFHSEQIKLVKNPERFELSKLKHIPEYAKDVFSTGNILKKQSADVLAKVLKARIAMLDKALCRGYH